MTTHLSIFKGLERYTQETSQLSADEQVLALISDVSAKIATASANGGNAAVSLSAVTSAVSHTRLPDGTIQKTTVTTVEIQNVETSNLGHLDTMPADLTSSIACLSSGAEEVKPKAGGHTRDEKGRTGGKCKKEKPRGGKPEAGKPGAKSNKTERKPRAETKGTKVDAAGTADALPPKADSCWWGVECRNSGCRYAHPKGRPQPNTPEWYAECKFGPGCRNLSSGKCMYRHPAASPLVDTFGDLTSLGVLVTEGSSDDASYTEIECGSSFKNADGVSDTSTCLYNTIATELRTLLGLEACVDKVARDLKRSLAGPARSVAQVLCDTAGASKEYDEVGCPGDNNTIVAFVRTYGVGVAVEFIGSNAKGPIKHVTEYTSIGSLYPGQFIRMRLRNGHYKLLKSNS